MNARLLAFRLKLARWIDRLFGTNCVHMPREEFEMWQQAALLRPTQDDRRPSGRLPGEGALHAQFEAGKAWGEKHAWESSGFHMTGPQPQLPTYEMSQEQQTDPIQPINPYQQTGETWQHWRKEHDPSHQDTIRELPIVQQSPVQKYHLQPVSPSEDELTFWEEPGTLEDFRRDAFLWDKDATEYRRRIE